MSTYFIERGGNRDKCSANISMRNKSCVVWFCIVRDRGHFGSPELAGLSLGFCSFLKELSAYVFVNKAKYCKDIINPSGISNKEN